MERDVDVCYMLLLTQNKIVLHDRWVSGTISIPSVESRDKYLSNYSIDWDCFSTSSAGGTLSMVRITRPGSDCQSPQ